MSKELSVTRNTKWLKNVTEYNITCDDDILNVDTSAGPLLLILPNIKNSGLDLFPKPFFINDVGGFVSTNNITVQAANNEVNGTSSIVFTRDGVSIQCVIANATEYILNVNSDGDDNSVQSYPSLASFPATGQSNTIYIAENTGYLYRWTGAAYSQVGGAAAPVSSVFGRTGAVVAVSGDYTAAQVTNAVSVLGSYSDPAWITALSWSKITGTPTTLAGYGITDAIGNSLNSGNILVGNVSNVAASVSMSGDVTISNTGVTAIGALKVTNAMLAGSIDNSKLSNSTISGISLGSNLNDLTVSTGLQYNTGSTYNGGTAKTISIDSTVVTLTGSQALSNKTGNISQWTNDSAYITLASALTGLSITGSSISASDSVIVAFGKLQNQINGVLGGAIYQGTWNATTNSPTLVSSTGTKGYYYVVSVAGSTNLDGETDWKIGDWAIFNGAIWQKVDNTDAVSSVNGLIGAVPLTGTANRITVSAANVFDISASYVGQSSITTLGTIGAGVWQGTSISTTYTDAKIKTVTGTSNRITIGGTATDPTFDISTSYAGQATIVTLGTVTTGTWSATAIAADKGGTGQTVYTVGDTLYASTTTALSKLNAVAAGSYFRSNGTGVAPLWSTNTIPNTTAANLIWYATGTNVIGTSTSFFYNGTTLKIGSTSVVKAAQVEVQGQLNINVALGGTSISWSDSGTSAYRALMNLAGTTADFQCFRATGTNGAEAFSETFRVTNAAGDFGIGTGATVSARLHAIKTTEQLRIGYDASNYWSVTVGSSGIVTWDAVGSASAFVFSDKVTLAAAVTGAASLAWTTGTAPTSPGTTDMWRDGSGLYLFDVYNVRAGQAAAGKYARTPGVIKHFFTTAGNSGSGATDAFSYTAEASILGTDGDSIESVYYGSYAANTNSKSIAVLFAGTTVFTSPAVTSASATSWRVVVTIIRDSSTSVKINVAYQTDSPATIAKSVTTLQTGLTLSNTNILKLSLTATSTDDIKAEGGKIYWAPNGI